MHLFFDATREDADDTTMPVGVVKADTCRVFHIELRQNFGGIGFHLVFY